MAVFLTPDPIRRLMGHGRGVPGLDLGDERMMPVVEMRAL